MTTPDHRKELPGVRAAVREEWPDPIPDLALHAGDVHVWRIELDTPARSEESRVALLSDDELLRARRFRLALHQSRYISGRAALRAILARYLAGSAKSLRFLYGSHGKPALENSELKFNLSHSGGLALCAVTRGRDVGVDLEVIREKRPSRRLAERFFAPEEVAAILQLPEDDQVSAFFQCWTLKEAYIKARGEGLAIPLDRFEVQWRWGDSEAALRVDGEPSEGKHWSLFTLDAAEGYAAALVVEGHRIRVARWTFLESV